MESSCVALTSAIHGVAVLHGIRPSLGSGFLLRPTSCIHAVVAKKNAPFLTKGGVGFVTAFANKKRLTRVVHIKLNRMRTHAQASDFFHFQLNEGADHVVSEHAASSQKAAIGIQFIQSLIE